MRSVNRRGQQMTLGTIIAIVLGLVVLVFLIYGFSTGWGNLWSKITGSVSGSNVEDRISDCETDCSLNEVTSYCFERKDLRFFDKDGKTVKVTGTCVDFADNAFVVENKVTAGQIREMGFDGCPAIECVA
jgi:hypothetical protein